LIGLKPLADRAGRRRTVNDLHFLSVWVVKEQKRYIDARALVVAHVKLRDLSNTLQSLSTGGIYLRAVLGLDLLEEPGVVRDCAAQFVGQLSQFFPANSFDLPSRQETVINKAISLNRPDKPFQTF
jgi:hypothetical protein